MREKDKEALEGAATLSVVAAALVCGVGLFMMALDGSVSGIHFIRLGMATLGAAIVGAVGGLFMFAALEEEKKKDKIEQPDTAPAAQPEDRSS